MDADKSHDLIDRLPGVLRSIGGLAGIRAALKIAELWGGTRLYFPREARPDHPLVQAIGAEAAAILCNEYACDRLEIPRAAGWFTAVRDRLILAQSETLSHSRLAHVHGVTERTIREALRRARGQVIEEG